MSLTSAHPLAESLAARLCSAAIGMVIGVGNGRNLPPLLSVVECLIAVDKEDARLRALATMLHDSPTRASLVCLSTDYTSIDLADASIDGILSTNSFQHGGRARIAAMIAESARLLRDDAPFYVAFGSKRDARYGQGDALEPDVYAPADGEEQGVAHAYFNPESLAITLAPYFTIERLVEADASRIVGSWAHVAADGIRHLLLQARRSQRSAHR